MTRDAEAQNAMLEQQADDLTSQLDEKVELLKAGVIDIGKLVKDDVRRLNDIEGDMSGVSGMLGGSMKKFEEMMGTGGTKTICYLAIFMVFVFFLFYWMLSRKWS